MALDRRIRQLEDRVVPDRIEWGTTRIDPDCMGEAERELMAKAWRISNKYMPMLEYDKDVFPSEAERLILDKVGSFLYQRALDLFKTVTDFVVCHDDDLQKVLFQSRLYWFIDEMITWFNNMREQDRIFRENEGASDEQLEKALEPLYAKWVKPFSPGSYEKLMDKIGFWKPTK